MLERNARLMRMMEDMHVVENRGSGIRAMLHALREANLEPPRFDDRRLVTFRNHTLIHGQFSRKGTEPARYPTRSSRSHTGRHLRPCLDV